MCFVFSLHWLIFVANAQILTPFLLRRLKSDVTLEVPPKKEIVVYAPMTTKQDAFYRAIVDKTIAKVLGQEGERVRIVLFFVQYVTLYQI